MKKKLIFLIVLSLVFTYVLAFGAPDTKSVAAAAPSISTVNFVNGVVTAVALNVRQGAAKSYPVVCVLKKGQKVKVFGKVGDWYAVYETSGGCVGAASSKYIKVSTTTAAPTTNKAPAPAAPAKPKPSSSTTTAPAGISQDEQALLKLVNKARADAGVAALAFDMDLVKVARLKAQDMVNNNYFSHQSPTYGSPFDMMKQFNISFKSAGENIAGNQTVSGAFTAWMNSAGHKKNILNGSYNYNGIGIVSSPTYGKILVQQFIGR